MSDLTNSSSFKCPSDFDIRETIIFYPYSSFNKAYLNAPANHVKYTLLNEGSPTYYFADGKFWRESVLPADLRFEVGHCSDYRGLSGHKHYHTSFMLHGDEIHIDQVFTYGRGPGSGQHYARIYVNDQIRGAGIVGGNSFGMNWSFNFPVKTMVGKYFLIHRAKFYTNLEKSFFPVGDKDCPLRIFYPVEKPELPFDVFMFDEKTLEKLVLNTRDVEVIESLFLASAPKDRIHIAVTKVIANLKGKTLSSYAIVENISGTLFEYSFKKYVTLTKAIEPLVRLGLNKEHATVIAKIVLEKIR